MSRSGKHTTSVLASAAIFIALEVAALSMLSGSSTLQDIWLNRISHRTMGFFWRGGENVRNYFSLKKQNEELAADNFELTRRLLEYEAAADIKECLKASPAPRSGYRYIPATIVKMSRNSHRNYFIIDRGSEDGVLPQSGIITEKGVVGIIGAVDRHYSYGLSFFNPEVVVSARLGRSGVLASLGWDGYSKDRARMRELPLHLTVTPGDTVWTSGFSTLFPPDIPVGTAGDIIQRDGASNDLEIKLLQDFSALRYVTVVENLNAPEITRLEKEAGRK